MTGEPEAGGTVTEMSDRDGPVVVRWTAPVWWGEPFNEYGRDVCYAVRTPEGVILIDPTVPPRALLGELERFWGEGPAAILLTSSWHERNCYVFRQLYGSEIWSSRPGAAENEGEPDHWFDNGDRLPGGMQAIQLADWFAGEAAFILDVGELGRALFTGDAIEGPVPGTDWRVSLQLYGDPTPEQYRESFRRVLEEPFDVIFPGHGQPIRDDPQGAVAELLVGGEITYTNDPAAQMPARRPESAG